MTKNNKMTKDAARRIQSQSDRTGKNPDFKSRAQSAADRNTNQSQGNTGDQKKQ